MTLRSLVVLRALLAILSILVLRAVLVVRTSTARVLIISLILRSIFILISLISWRTAIVQAIWVPRRTILIYGAIEWGLSIFLVRVILALGSELVLRARLVLASYLVPGSIFAWCTILSLNSILVLCPWLVVMIISVVRPKLALRVGLAKPASTSTR